MSSGGPGTARLHQRIKEKLSDEKSSHPTHETAGSVKKSGPCDSVEPQGPFQKKSMLRLASKDAPSGIVGVSSVSCVLKNMLGVSRNGRGIRSEKRMRPVLHSARPRTPRERFALAASELIERRFSQDTSFNHGS